MKRLIALLALLAAIVPSLASAQTPPAVSTFLLDAQDIGADWSSLGQAKPDIGDSVFTDAASVVMAGPQGAQIVVILFRHPTDRGSVLQAWTQAQHWYSNAKFDAMEIYTSYDREQELRDRPLPEGTVQADRADGMDQWWQMPGGIGLYAIEPDVIALVLVRGFIHADSEVMQGADATDFIAELVAQKVVDFG